MSEALASNAQSFTVRAQVMRDTLNEIARAHQKHGGFNSAHEAYAVILEELDEVWEIIKRNGPADELYHELIQVAAMAMAAAQDVRPTKEPAT